MSTVNGPGPANAPKPVGPPRAAALPASAWKAPRRPDALKVSQAARVVPPPQPLTLGQRALAVAGGLPGAALGLGVGGFSGWYGGGAVGLAVGGPTGGIAGLFIGMIVGAGALGAVGAYVFSGRTARRLIRGR